MTGNEGHIRQVRRPVIDKDRQYDAHAPRHTPSGRLLFPIQVSEFISAAGKPYSYDIRANIYILFGVLWGLPIPLVTMYLEYRYLKASGVEAPFGTVLGSPIQFFFFIHPVIFGIIFGILGTIRQEKDRQLAATIEKLESLSTHDSLTGLKNRRAFSLAFQDECARSQRRGDPLSLLFIDIDHFKNINDTYGHQAGDTVLKKIGDYLRSQCRPYDTAARWGGEEFVLLLQTTGEREAASAAERLRRNVESGLSEEIPFHFTVSIGVARYETGDTLESLCERADKALYHAKQSGRNRVICWGTLSPPAKP